jgi:hypothetical protein
MTSDVFVNSAISLMNNASGRRRCSERCLSEEKSRHPHVRVMFPRFDAWNGLGCSVQCRARSRQLISDRPLHILKRSHVTPPASRRARLISNSATNSALSPNLSMRSSVPRQTSSCVFMRRSPIRLIRACNPFVNELFPNSPDPRRVGRFRSVPLAEPAPETHYLRLDMQGSTMNCRGPIASNRVPNVDSC